jgi:UDP-N-acetylmuramyl tripeptide synthase
MIDHDGIGARDVRPRKLGVVRPRFPLALEIVVARSAGRLSRLVGAGGGTTIPGKVLWTLDPTAVDRLAARLPLGAALVSATNGKTTTSAMAAEILEPRIRLAHNAAGANLVSGVASALLASDGSELGLFEVDEGALPEVARRVRPRVVCLGNLFRDQLDRWGELELVAARWRKAVESLAGAVVVVNGDDPQVGDLARSAERAVVFGLDDPRHATALPHAADSKWCVHCGTPYVYAAAYVGHLGDYRCPACGRGRPPLDVVAREIELHGLDASRFQLATAEWTRTVELRLPGLYNVYNAVAAASLARELGASADEIEHGLRSFSAAFGRFEEIRVGDRAVLVLLVKNPAGANEVVRTLVAGGAPPLAVVALNDAIADGQDVSWIWDVDWEPLLERLDRVVVTGTRAQELALRFAYAGFDRDALEVVPSLGEALDRGLALTPPGERLFVLPTYTAMLALREIVSARGFVRPYWEAAA